MLGRAATTWLVLPDRSRRQDCRPHADKDVPPRRQAVTSLAVVGRNPARKRNPRQVASSSPAPGRAAPSSSSARTSSSGTCSCTRVRGRSGVRCRAAAYPSHSSTISAHTYAASTDTHMRQPGRRPPPAGLWLNRSKLGVYSVSLRGLKFLLIQPSKPINHKTPKRGDVSHGRTSSIALHQCHHGWLPDPGHAVTRNASCWLPLARGRAPYRGEVFNTTELLSMVRYPYR